MLVGFLWETQKEGDDYEDLNIDGRINNAEMGCREIG
jgi:hypothetical protein